MEKQVSYESRLTPEQEAIKEFCDKVWQLKPVEQDNNFYTMYTRMPGLEVENALYDSSLHELMLDLEEDLGDEDHLLHEKPLGLSISRADLLGASLRLERYVRDKVRINPDARTFDPDRYITFPDETDWEYTLEIGLHYAQPGNTYVHASQNVLVQSQSKDSNVTLMRHVDSIEYADIGYEHHKQKVEYQPTAEQLDDFMSLAKSMYEARRQPKQAKAS